MFVDIIKVLIVYFIVTCNEFLHAARLQRVQQALAMQQSSVSPLTSTELLKTTSLAPHRMANPI